MCKTWKPSTQNCPFRVLGGELIKKLLSAVYFQRVKGKQTSQLSDVAVSLIDIRRDGFWSGNITW
jgi:hypothetical protein